MAPTCLRPLLRYRSFAILFFTPLLLLPLPVTVPTRVSACGAQAGSAVPRVRALLPDGARPPAPRSGPGCPEPRPSQPHRRCPGVLGAQPACPARVGPGTRQAVQRCPPGLPSMHRRSPPERAVADAHRGTSLPDGMLKHLLHATLPQRNFNAAQKGPQSSTRRSQGRVLQLLLPSDLHCRSPEMGAQCQSIHPKGWARARTWASHRPNPSCELDAILFGPKISSWPGQVELHPRLSRNDWQWTEIQDFWVF